jgi:hypothetical protein
MTRSVSSRLLEKFKKEKKKKMFNSFKIDSKIENGVTDFQELLGDSLVVHLNFRHHIAWNVSRSAGHFTPIESISVFIASHLNLQNSIQFNSILKMKIVFTLMSWPSRKGNSSSQASGFGDMVGGS